MPYSPIDKVVRFGPFELSLATADLCRGERKVRLPEQQFQVLEMLLRANGDLVSREDIRKRLWPNDTIVEFDTSINSTIKKLRASLGDSADHPRFIETVSRRGYRIMVAVEFPEAAPVASVPTKTFDGALVGQRISHYRVLQIVGGGGMGVVYRAEDIKLGRPVALKFLPSELADDATAKDRLEREARAASALNHPNICTIHEIDEHQGQRFIAMELLEGRTLSEMLSGATTAGSDKQQGSFPPELLVNIAIQIANGLDAAHKKGIIQRDIKPANIFVTSHGQAKILDFGLAKLHEVEGAELPLSMTVDPGARGEPNALLTLTRTGVTIGTAAYMSPEQVRGEKLDPRTDLFSFGLVIYEMASNQRAFPGNTAQAVQEAILTQAPPAPSELNPEIPANLEKIITKLIEKDRESRYQSASELRADLERLSRAKENHWTAWWPLSTIRSRSTRILIVSLLTLLLAAPILWLLTPRRSGSATPTFTQLTDQPGPEIYPGLSPDGKSLVYQSRASGKWDIYLQRVGGKNPVNLTAGSADSVTALVSP
jgi:serine/threonine protein kinase